MIDTLVAQLLANLGFFATGFGLLVIGGTALLTILLWEWRLTLLGLVAVQLGVAVLVTRIHGLPTEWASVQLMVTALAAAMLALSARQVRPALRVQRPGSFVVRLCGIVLLLVGWQFVELDLQLPGLTPQEVSLFSWLVLCAFVMLGFGDSPLYTGVALLLWLIPVQAFIQVLLPDQRLFVLIGIGQIFLALACSYLLLAQRLPALSTNRVLTDMTFPDELQITPQSARLTPARQLGLKQNPAPAVEEPNWGGRFLPEAPDTAPTRSSAERTQAREATGEHPLVKRRLRP